MNGKHRSAGHAYRGLPSMRGTIFRSDGDPRARRRTRAKLSHALVAVGIGNALKRAGIPASNGIARRVESNVECAK